MYIRLNALTKVFISTLFLTGLIIVLPTTDVTPKVSAQSAACCYGSPLATDGGACQQTSQCGANECAYVNQCYTCTQADAMEIGCQPGRIYATTKGCRPKTACENGTLTCGSCTEDPPDGSAPPPPSGCYWPGGLQFGSDTLIQPANNSTGLDPAVIQFQWRRVGAGNNVYAGQDWGHVDNPCTLQFRIYTIYLREANADGTCSTTRSSFTPIDFKEYPATNAGNITNGGNDPMIVPNIWKNNMLKYATSYCWYVKKENKVGAPRYSAIWKFTTEARPILTGSRIINPRNNAEVATCGTDIRRIGRYSASSTVIQNPMDIEVTYRDPDSTGDFTNLMIALLPTVHTNTQSTRIMDTTVDNRIVAYRTLAARFGINNTLTTKNMSTLNLSAAYSPNATSGDINNNIDGNATILSMASATNITLTLNGDGSRTIVAKFRVRFNDNFPNNTSNSASSYYNYYNIYSMLTFTRTRTNINNGNVVTTTYTADFDQTTLTGVNNYLNTSRLLYIDTTAPNPVLTSTTNADNSFNVVWRASDNLALEPNTGFKTSVHANLAGDSLMQDYPSGTIINPVPTSEPGSSNLNAYLNLSNGVNHTEVYRDQNSGIASNSIFTLDTDDLSCNNGRFQLTVTGLPSPWLSVFNSNASIGNVMSGSVIPPISPYTQLFGLEDSSDSTQPYTTAYAFLLGTTSLPSSYISKKGLYASQYPDLSDEPPVGTSWYAYFSTKVTESSTPYLTRTTTTVTNTGGSTTSLDMAATFAQASGAKTNFFINGDLTINQRVNCNTRSIFVISGNLVIHSDFQIRENSTAGVYNGCVFVVQGNVTIFVNTPNSSRFKFPVTGEHATYGLLEASIFTDGSITLGTTSATTKGVFIVGNITAKGNIVSTTVFSGSENLTKPSLLVYTDPRYAVTFMEDLGVFSYSIREEGFVQ